MKKIVEMGRNFFSSKMCVGGGKAAAAEAAAGLNEKSRKKISLQLNLIF